MFLMAVSNICDCCWRARSDKGKTLLSFCGWGYVSQSYNLRVSYIERLKNNAFLECFRFSVNHPMVRPINRSHYDYLEIQELRAWEHVPGNWELEAESGPKPKSSQILSIALCTTPIVELLSHSWLSKSWGCQSIHGCAESKSQDCLLECSYFNIPEDISEGNIYEQEHLNLWIWGRILVLPLTGSTTNLSLSFLFRIMVTIALPPGLFWRLMYIKYLDNAWKHIVSIH